MLIGFAKTDITPRVGVELCGFGPFLNRRSIGIRDRLWSRAMAVRVGETTAVVISNDIIQLSLPDTRRIRQIVHEETGLAPEHIMVHCTHTHSGPATGTLAGWGMQDAPYLETLPRKVAQAAIDALRALQPATLSHAEVPCEGVGLNREYDKDAPPLEDVLKEDWRPARPELTDTKCQVLVARAEEGDKRIIGFASYFGCHPVVCCAQTRYIHGDYAGVATNLLEREHPGSVGLFLQGAQGDVNSCVVHKPEQDSLLALDVIAARYARAVRRGMAEAKPVEVAEVVSKVRPVTFSRKQVTREYLVTKLAEQEAILHAPGASDEASEVRMAMVFAQAYRKLLRQMDAGESLEAPTEVQGLRLGSVTLLGGPFEIFQAIKNDVRAGARSPQTMVMGLTNDQLGYAPDKTAAARGGYAADMVPLMLGTLPFAGIHDELVRELLAVEDALYE
ncbi:MAG: neutral/alkaline non-lysosomal ceramidase N-terminal domain-containing protein [Armatimonadia bacterium]